MNQPAVLPLTYSRKELAQALGLGLATLDRLNAGGKLPRAVTLSAGRIAWRRETIDRWLQSGCPDRLTFEKRFGR